MEIHNKNISSNRVPLTPSSSNQEKETDKKIKKVHSKLNKNKAPVQSSLTEKTATQKTPSSSRRVLEVMQRKYRDLIKLLPSLNEAENALKKEGKTLLMIATEQKHLALVRALLRAGAPLNATDNGGRTALMYAAMHGKVKILRELLKTHADSEVQDEDGYTALMIAVKTGQTAVVKALVKAHAKIDTPDKTGKTALMYATEEGNLRTVKALIDAGANIGLKNKAGHTPLMTAIQKGDLKIIRLLKKAGGDSETFKQSTPPLTLAVMLEKKEVVEVLVEENPQTERRDFSGFTALTWAAMMGQPKILEVLLKAGADVEASDEKGNTALVWAVKAAQREENPSDHKAVIELLIAHHANIDAPNKFGFSPITTAMEKNDTAMVDYLVGKGADRKFATQFLRNKLFANIWELNGTSTAIDKNGKSITFELEGFRNYMALGRLSSYIHDFLLPLENRAEIEKALTDSFPLLSTTPSIYAEKRLARLQLGDVSPIFILSGTEDHAIAIILYRDRLIVCNRGQRNPRHYENTAEIYFLPPSMITKTMLQSLATAALNIDLFDQKIDQLNLEYLGGFYQGDQTVSNCTWANSESGLDVLCRMYAGSEVGETISRAFSEYARRRVFDEYTALPTDERDETLIERAIEKQKKQTQNYS